MRTRHTRTMAAAAKFAGIPKNPDYITKDMHIKLLQWKMSQGQYRPMLMKYANELTEDIVESTSRAAFLLLKAGKHIEAIEMYKKLKGTGYALASLVMSTQSADIPFMSDHLLHILVPDGKYKYTKKEYMACYEYAHTQAAKHKTTARGIEEYLRDVK